MVEYSRFFGGPVGSVPEYTQPQFAEVLAKLFSDGVFTDIDNELEVVETDPVALAVRVNTGEAWIQGFWYQNTAYLTKSLAAADPDDPRIDRIVLRLDTITNFKISIEVLTGTPAETPAAPTLTQTASTYEISLAQVSVLANATSVDNAKITDERTYAAVSGITPISGWISTGTFTYASATTITVASGAASIYQKGDKLRFKQTAGTYKYCYVVSVANTVLTVTGGSDYAVLDQAITVPAYSHVENPLGFPMSFLYLATETGFSGTPTQVCRFKLSGGICTVWIYMTGTSDANTFQVGLPITSNSRGFTGQQTSQLRGMDNSAEVAVPYAKIAGDAQAIIHIYKDYNESTWTTSGAKGARLTVSYEIA